MNKSFLNKNSFKTVLLCLIAVLGTTSCLDMETGITLKRSGKVETRITYRLSSEAAEFGRGFGADEPWPFPLTEKDFRFRSVSFPGTEVKHYRTGSESDGSEWIRVDLESKSIKDLASYMDFDLSLESDGKTGRMEFNLPSPVSLGESDEILTESLIRSAGETRFIFSFRPPSKPADCGIGRLDGRDAVLEITLSDLLSSEDRTRWTVLW